MEQRKIYISTGIIFRTILILLAVWFLYLILDVVSLIVISVIISSAIDPLVDLMKKKKIPRSIGVLVIYIVLFAFIGVAIYFIIPPIAEQSRELAQEFPVYYQRTLDFLGPIKTSLESSHIETGRIFGNLTDSLAGISGNIFSTTIGFFSGIISVIVVLSLTFYMAAEEDALKKFVISVTPKKHHTYAVDLAERIKSKIGKWLIGQLFLMIIVGTLSGFGLYLIGVPHALILGIFAGIMEIVPYIGPLVSAVPGVILGFIVSPTVGFLAILIYIIVQQIENHVVVPQVMKKAVGLSPITVIIVLMIGAKLGGALGAILSIPVATAAGLFIADIMGNNDK
ncbi:MAG TPA: AI-2E family transporter [Candidatus Moranbacteria bacterium]|nr:AI-2E family transporter [Candidatus Moranbacteria bacterium]